MQLLLRLQDRTAQTCSDPDTEYPDRLRTSQTSNTDSAAPCGRSMSPGCGDVVAMWDVGLSDGVYRIQFSHGTTTGKRVIYVNGKEVLRRDWMFKLVGTETFRVGTSDTKATISIEAVGGLAYEYSLLVDGKSLQKFIDNRAKTTKTWVVQVDGTDYRVVFEKETMDIWCNGQKMDTMGEFVDDGTDTHFLVGDHSCCIKATSSGKKKSGIVHSLLLDGQKVPDQRSDQRPDGSVLVFHTDSA